LQNNGASCFVFLHFLLQSTAAASEIENRIEKLLNKIKRRRYFL
jgi:hypothetical protein